MDRLAGVVVLFGVAAFIVGYDWPVLSALILLGTLVAYAVVRSANADEDDGEARADDDGFAQRKAEDE